MAKNAVPSLSASGWVSEITEKADKLLSYYFTSDYSQSNLYEGTITSLPYQIQQRGHDEFGLKTYVRDELQAYLEKYFDTARVETSTDHPNENDPNRINLTVSVIVTQDGVNYSLGRLIAISNSKILEIININNNIGGN